MAETITTVDTDGTGSYSSLSAWEGAIAGDHTAATGDDTQHTAKCQATSGSADTTRVTINGSTLDAANYLKVWTDTAESYRHDGSGVYPTGNTYRMEVVGDHSVYIQDDYVRVDGLAVRGTHTTINNKYNINAQTLAASNDIRISNCLLTAVISGTVTGIRGIRINDTDAVVTIWNNIIRDVVYTTNATMRGIDVVNCTTADIFNNTIHNCYTAGIRRVSGTVTSTNNVVFGRSDDHNGTMTITYCATDDTETGTGNIDTLTWADEFVDYTNDDFSPAAASSLGGAGTDTPTGYGLADGNDIKGNARTSTWDIGAIEYIASGRIMSSLANYGGLAGHGGIAGYRGGLAG